MATDAQNIATRRSAILAELAALTSTVNGGKPTYNVHGQMVDHVGYRLSLLEELKLLNDLQASAEGPFEIVEQGVT